MDNFNKLRDKYRRGVATPSEKETFLHLLAFGVDEDELLREEWKAHGEIELSAEDQVRGERTLGRLMEDISQNGGEMQGDVAPRRSRFGAVGLGVFCLVLLVLGGVEYAEYAVTPAPGGTVCVSAAEPRRVDLPGGSIMFLNEGSEVCYEGDFRSGIWEITLNGEAFVDMRRDLSTPLRFRTNDKLTTIQGTTFDVKAQGDSILIIPMGGPVVMGDGKRVIGEVNVNNQMVVNTKDFASRQQEVVPGAEMFWETEFLILGEVSVGEAFRRVGRRFDVKIEITNPELSDCVVHIGLEPEEQLKPIVDVLCRSVNATAVKRRDRIKIIGGHCR
jgi:transmembrane sensor